MFPHLSGFTIGYRGLQILFYVDVGERGDSSGAGSVGFYFCFPTAKQYWNRSLGIEKINAKQ